MITSNIKFINNFQKKYIKMNNFTKQKNITPIYMANQYISHEGIVTEITPHAMHISIYVTSGCSSCTAKGSCNMSEGKDKTITVPLQSTPYHVGDHVNILMKERSGLFAVFIAYILPIILLVILLMIAQYNNVSEAITGILLLTIITLYFATLMLFQKQLKQKFTFIIEKK